MSAFDPDTGFRVVPDAGSVASGSATPGRVARNPYDLALGVIWVSAAALSLVLVIFAAALSSTQTGGGNALALSGVLAVLAVLVGSIHLGVRAIGWRPPEG